MKHMFGHDTITDSRKKGDLLLIAAVCLAAVLAALFFFGKNSAPAAYAVIELDGREQERLPLSKDQEICVEGQGGYNVVSVSDGEVRVLDADCPDGLCVRQGRIRHAGQSIVCLPHRLSVRLEAEETGGLDAVVQ